jgi:hypothetical protein
VPAWGRVIQVVAFTFTLLLLLGLPVLLVSSRLGLLLIVVGMAGYFLTQLTVSIVGYRQTMRRPWPKVPPVEDDDDDW